MTEGLNFCSMAATSVSPIDESTRGMIAILESINSAEDFKEFMSSYLKNNERSRQFDKSDRVYKEYKVQATLNRPKNVEEVKFDGPKLENAYFGKDLAILLQQESRLFPVLLEKCIEFIESSNLGVDGLYRVPGSSSVVNKVKQAFENGKFWSYADPSISLSDYAEDVHNVTSLLKLYFRLLPDPLFTKSLYQQFIQAAKIDDVQSRLRTVTVHELVNALPDPNYATLRELLKHLSAVCAKSDENLMTVGNLAIVWGPTLLDPAGDFPMDFKMQAKTVEIVLSNFDAIFEV